MAKNRVLFINGTITVNPSGTPVTTLITDASAVVLQIENENLMFKGANPTATEMHTIGYTGKVIIKELPIKREFLDTVLGMTTVVGTLNNGSTVSQNSKLSHGAGYDKPELEYLISGKDNKTGAVVEIYVKKGVISNNLDINVSSSEFFQQDVEITALGSSTSLTDATIEFREQDTPVVSTPVITAIYPATGGTAGGDDVVIIGSGFVANATVTIGGDAATSISVVNATTITCTTPAHAGGAEDVVVTNPDAGTDTLTDGFTFA